MIRSIIIDDEFLARKRIHKLLEDHPDISVIGEAKNGTEAVALIQLKEPDLIFLDIQMPDFDGFSVVRKLAKGKVPYVVFTTAFNKYAIEAFNIHAMDYLLKPIDKDRFNESIKKVLQRFEAHKSAELNKKLMKMVKDFQVPSDDDFLSRIIINERGWEYEVDLDEVTFIEANGNYVNLNTLDKTYLYRITMSHLVSQLNPEEFIRVHRSFILNKRYIGKCHYVSNNEYRFVMKNGHEIISGRSYKEDIVATFSQ
ncbi:LytR/AlgR family response regulator transcription factor [Roseivirga sp.]|uniref:LytR/AlgR family response regulator transcription factor n=1 Tax=Roseivirga sp. TaxID=1964215 RepID=UPI003B52F650